MKSCSTCQINQDLSKFFNDKKAKDGKCGRCKKCCEKATRNWRKAHAIERREAGIKWRQNNPQKVSNYNIVNNLKKFGLTERAYNLLLEKQNGLCALCTLPEVAKRNGKYKALAVDHSHMTGNVRGLLCSKCNTALGLMFDNEELLFKAAIYVMENK